MAVVDRQGKVTGSGGSSSTPTQSQDKVELKPITLEEMKAKGLIGPSIQLNLEEDAWERSAPPPRGRYQLRIFLSRDGFKYGYINPKAPKDDEIFVTAPLECKVVSDNPDYDGTTVFAGVGTRIYRGKDISTMIGLIVKGLGAKAIPKGGNLTTYEQVALFSSFLKKEPIVEADLDWRGSYKMADGTYDNALKHYEDFPEDPDDTSSPKRRLHITEISAKDGGTVEVTAQLYVATWYAKGEASKVEKVGKVGKALEFVQPGVGVVTPALVNPPVVNVPQPVQGSQVVNGPVQQNLPLGQPSQQQVEDDMALLLDT